MATLTLGNATTVAVRPIEAADRAALAAAFGRLSSESRQRRFLSPKRELSGVELSYLTEIDHVTHEALVALDSRRDIVAVARYAARPASRDAAEVALVVADAWQRRGLGSALSAAIVAHARENGFAALTATTLWDNIPARALIARLGFRRVESSDGVASYRLELAASEAGRTRGPACGARRPARRSATAYRPHATPGGRQRSASARRSS